MKPSTRNMIVIGATGIALLAGGALPALASSKGVPAGLGIGWHGGPANAGKSDAHRRGQVAAGTITAVSGTSLALQPFARKHATTTPPALNVSVGTTTRILLDGKEAALSNLSVGARAIVSGTVQPNGSIAATQLLIRTASSTHPHSGKHGKGHGHVHFDD